MPIYVEGSEVAALPGVDAVYLDGEQVWPTGPRLVGYYTFDDTADDVAAAIVRDSSGRGHDIKSVPHQSRRSPGYDGSQYASLGGVTIAGTLASGNDIAPFIDTKHMTATCWYLNDGTKPAQETGLIEYSGGSSTEGYFRLSQSVSGNMRIQFRVTSSGGTQSSSLFTPPASTGPDDWRHLAIVYEASTGTGSVYLDGSLMIQKVALPGPLLEPITTLSTATGTGGRNRVIDSPRFYLGALTEDEIRADMLAT